jgi:hypothetical protein
MVEQYQLNRFYWRKKNIIYIYCFQGFLYKKGTNSINRDWKKKYVVLLDDGRLIYHPSLHVNLFILFQIFSSIVFCFHRIMKMNLTVKKSFFNVQQLKFLVQINHVSHCVVRVMIIN